MILGFFAVSEPLALALVFGALQGLATGVSFSLTSKLLFASVSGTGGLVAGIQASGPAMGSLINIGLAYAVINPKNAAAELRIGNTLYFSDSDIIDRVPYYFLVSGVFSALTSAAGMVMICIGSTNTKDAFDKSTSISRNQQKSERIQSTFKPNYESQRFDQTTHGHTETKTVLCSQPNGSYGSPWNNNMGTCAARAGKEKFDSNPKLVGQSRSGAVLASDTNEELEKIKLIRNGPMSVKDMATINSGNKDSDNSTSLSQPLGQSITKHNLRLENTDIMIRCDQRRNQDAESVQSLKSKDDERRSSDQMPVTKDGQDNDNGTHRENRDAQTKSAFTSECDLTPWETLQTRRFWFAWLSVVALSHTLYVQTSLFKQYGQLVISSDVVLVVTALLSTGFLLVTRPSIGAFSDRFGVPESLVAVSFTSSIFMTLMVVGAHFSPGLYVLASIVEFATVSTIPVVNNLLVASLFGKTHFASNMGLVYSAFIVSVIVEPFIFTWMERDLGWDWIFVCGSTSSMLSMIFSILI